MRASEILDRRHALIAGLAGAVTSLSGCGEVHQPPEQARILLFAGVGTSRNDVTVLERILSALGHDYAVVNSNQLGALDEATLRTHRLLIVPGGNFEAIGRNLTPAATANIRSAVRSGLNYLGLCAGAFFAGASPYNGLNITDGVRLEFYALEAQGTRKSLVPIVFADGSTSDHYWEDGPQLNGWGNVVATYPNGASAIVEGQCGAGWAVLTGTHPEAPASWLQGMTPATAAQNRLFTGTLIDAALHGMRLATP